jgi:large subunit ribosomal protein L18
MSNNVAKKLFNRILRKRRIRARVSGTTARPRLSVSVSNRHISAQIIDDTTQKTLVASSTVKSKSDGTLTDKAVWVGTDIAKKAKKAKLTQVVLDRGGRKYHGRVAALADAARKEGLEF